MKRYDPEQAPDPEVWLELDEQERIILIEDHHRRARVDLPEPTLHALMHEIVENQIATGIEPIARTLERLIDEGLTRHDGVHAIGAIIAQEMLALMEPGAAGNTAQARIEALVMELSAEKWRNS